MLPSWFGRKCDEWIEHHGMVKAGHHHGAKTELAGSHFRVEWMTRRCYWVETDHLLSSESSSSCL